MFRAIPWSCFLLLLHSAFSENLDCQESKVGQVGLYGYGDPLPNSHGIVVVCVEVEQPPPGMSKYQNAAVCWGGDSTFNEGAAAAACRQGGYSKHASYSFGSDYGVKNPDDVDYYISEIQCPIVKDYATQGETVLLRCSHTHAQNGIVTDICPTSELAAVECRGKNITSSESNYPGQIYIGHLPNLAEPLYPHIMLEDKLLPICVSTTNNPDSVTVGRSICRQLGYTDVYADIVYTVVTIKQESWYLGSLQCDSISYSCFTDCFNHSIYTNVSSCDEGDKIGLGVLCIYNESNAGVYGSGSGTLCQIETNTSPSGPSEEQNVGLIVSLAVFIVLTFILFLLLVMLLCCICKCRTRQEKDKIEIKDKGKPSFVFVREQKDAC